MDRARAALFYPISGRSRAQHEKKWHLPVPFQ